MLLLLNLQSLLRALLDISRAHIIFILATRAKRAKDAESSRDFRAYKTVSFAEAVFLINQSAELRLNAACYGKTIKYREQNYKIRKKFEFIIIIDYNAIERHI